MEKKEGLIYEIVDTLVLSFIVMYAMGQFIGVRSVTWRHLLLMVVAASVCIALHQASASVRIICGVALAGVIMGAGVLLVWDNLQQMMEGYGNWIVGDTDWKENLWIVYEFFQVIWLVTGAYGLGLLSRRFYAVKLLIAGALIAFLASAVFLQIELPKAGAVWGISYPVMVYA